VIPAAKFRANSYNSWPISSIYFCNGSDIMLPATPTNSLIRPLRAASVPLLALNNAHATELSPLTLEEFDRLIETSFYAAQAPDAAAFLLTFDQNANYASPNFLWFRERYDRFIYIDRVVTSPLARGQGYAKALYSDLFHHARAAGHFRIVCEVNLIPPNRASDAFHDALGFSEVGRASIHDGLKTVRYLLRSL
jgi:predicted GNAT superfamily acetyltransferase